jgi:hypothetical protein
MNKHTVNYTKEDQVTHLREVFLKAYLEHRLSAEPETKEKLEEKFKQFVDQIQLKKEVL